MQVQQQQTDHIFKRLFEKKQRKKKEKLLNKLR